MTHRLAVAASMCGLTLVVACNQDPQGPGGAPQSRVVVLQASQSTSCALLANGNLWCWGPGIGTVAPASDFSPVQEPVPDSVTAFALSDRSLCVATGSDSTYCWGDWYPIDSPVSYGDRPTLLADTLSLRTLAGGMGHTCGILTTSEPVCWGSSLLGKRGLGTPDPTLGSTTPNRVVGATGYSAVAAGRNHTCGLIQSGGLVACWGDGFFLGDSSGTLQFSDTACFYTGVACALSPVPVTSLSGITQIAAGSQGTCALGASVWCWGQFATLAPRPVAIPLPESARQITVGNGFACALTVTGRAYCWGRTGPWLGYPGPGSVPAQVQTTLRFSLLAAGNEHTCGVADTGQVYCWGAPTFGALGPGLDTPTRRPTHVEGPW